MSFQREAGCLCGAVRLRMSEAASETYHCHCSMCRKASGSLFQTFSAYPRAGFAYLSGKESLACYRSSPGVARWFCRSCGCQLLCEVDAVPDLVYVNSGAIDGGAHPGHPQSTERHIFVGSKVPWLEIGDGLPQFTDA
jgi:hypothetical protein